ncbi:uncharacterized protein [Zea mays]|uniref:uncharacterized protein n=1 Tax=Zea mays TaxID=4577 RepID=UPI000C6C4C3F|nr:uncharacterized protein LOC109944066 [Zea mays]XP_023157451.1 uncharacterized protein LOC109944066 [Zea mays]|eukprot:XP_023157450.1 uncharacterized protein LOC109944066 [Zea mays]
MNHRTEASSAGERGRAPRSRATAAAAARANPAAAARRARWWPPSPPCMSSAASVRTGRRRSADWAGPGRNRWWAQRSSARGLPSGACAFLSSGSGSSSAWNDAVPGPAHMVGDRSSDDGVLVSLPAPPPCSSMPPCRLAPAAASAPLFRF